MKSEQQEIFIDRYLVDKAEGSCCELKIIKTNPRGSMICIYTKSPEQVLQQNHLPRSSLP